MIVSLLSMETLEGFSSFRFQNDSFKEWCKEHQDDVFTVLESYPDGTLKLKGCNFVISSEYTNYRVKVVKQLRDETGAGMMDCKKVLVYNNWDYDKAKEELKSWGRSGLIDRWEYPKWLFIHSDEKGNNEYLEYERVEDYLRNQGRW